MSVTTKPRWYVSGQDLIYDAGNKSVKIPEDWPDELVDLISQLPYDYLDLGNATADEHYKVSRLETNLEHARSEIDTLQQRIEAEGQEHVIPILAADLETAINMAIRFATSLGLQANPDPNSIYGRLQALANKYKMTYHPPTDYDYRSMILPVDQATVRALSIDEDSPMVLDAPLTEDEKRTATFAVALEAERGRLTFKEVKECDTIEGTERPQLTEGEDGQDS